VRDASRVIPGTRVHDQVPPRPAGNKDIELDLLYDHRTNVPLYPHFQAFFRRHEPPTLIIWSRNEKIFPGEGARC
jgi:hypothetical protein